MKRFRILVSGALLMTLAGTPLPAQLSAELEAVDAIIESEDADAAISRLEALESRATGSDAAEVYWRLAQATLMLGDQREVAGAGEDELLAIYERGERYGEQAIDADPGNNLGYYWTSANVGRWGQTQGVLNSLFRAPDMRDLLTESVNLDPDHADSYYVLGQLYAQVPGVISFGNVEYAVSLGRKSVDLMEAELAAGEREELNEDFYIQLASHLISRDWNRRRRARNMGDIRQSYQNAGTPIERGFFYEGSASVRDGEDAAEAREILDEVIDRLEGIGNRSPSENRRLEEALELREAM